MVPVKIAQFIPNLKMVERLAVMMSAHYNKNRPLQEHVLNARPIKYRTIKTTRNASTTIFAINSNPYKMMEAVKIVHHSPSNKEKMVWHAVLIIA